MIDPTTGEEQPHPLESSQEAMIMQGMEMNEKLGENNALLEALVLKENSTEPFMEAQIIQDKQIGDKIVEAVKESNKNTLNLELDGVELATLKGETGEDGPPGKTPEKGVDYFTPEDIQEVAKETVKLIPTPKNGKDGENGYTPIKGVDYFDGINGENGADGISPIIDEEAIIEKVVKKIPKIKVPKDGKDGSPDTGEEIVTKLSKLKGDKRLDKSAIKGLDKMQKEINHIAGFSSQGQEYRISGTKVANNAGVLNFVAGSGATITGVPTSDGATITIGASGGGGAVDSVNGQTGVVVLDTGDIAEATDANYVSDAQLVVIGNTSGTNTGDQNLSGYELLSNKSTSTSLGTSDTLYPTQNAVKTYADNLIVGLLDYRGAYDASVNTFPTSGGSGTAGAVLKGDLWIISVAGTLGGTAVQIGDSVIANVDTPGQTAGNWNVLNGNISYVPEDVANKENTTIDTSTTKYPTVNLLKTGLDAKVPYTGATGDVNIGTYGLTAHNIKGDASDGLLIEASNGTDIAILGAGNTANGTWYGSHNIEGTQVAIGKNATTLGKLKLYGNTSGDVTIQPNAVAGTGVVLTAPATTGTLVIGGGTASGTNTGDQTSVSGNAGTATALATPRTIGTLTGDVTSTGSSFDGTGNNTNSTTVTKINGTSLAGLATGILKNTTSTGVPSIAVNSDLPVMTATVGGAVPTPPNNTTTFLRGDGTFAAPSGGFTSQVKAYLGSNQTISTGFAARATLVLDTESYDTGSEFNTGTYTFTAGATGYYQVCATLNWGSWVANTGFEFYMVIATVEKLMYNLDMNNGTGAWVFNYSQVIKLSATETLSFKAAQYTGSNKTLTGGDYSSWVTITRVG